MKVLSLFDGMSCGRIALDRAGIKVTSYHASELDKYAIKVTQANWPETVQLGDVTKWREWDIDWVGIDLLIGGSPCQGFSFAGKQLAFDDPRSALFFVYVDILKHIRTLNPDVKFMLENVRMKKEYLDVISGILEVEPVFINSNLVSAQNRQRFYWANWTIEQPEDKRITWVDIKENNAPDCHYYTEMGLDWIKRHSERTGKKLRIWGDLEKCQMLEASMFKNYSGQRFFAVEDVNGKRYISLLECERAQTVPDNYTNHVSNTQRYKMLGNGWTVDVIAHIFKQGLK
jgi:site-specific DNA-cytosine methylase